MRRIGLFTSARSDYGLQRGVIQILSKESELDLLVGGSHYMREWAGAIAEIENDSAVASARVVPLEFMTDGTSGAAQAKAVGLGVISIAQLFSMRGYDMIVCLGDRWELFSLTVPALLAKIPVAHISGGEVTEGVIDDSVRHATSKLSHLHFAANECYARNLSLMGEEDWRITVSGECGLDTIHREDIATRDDVEKQFGLDLNKPTALVTFHPSTMDPEYPVERQIQSVLEGLKGCADLQVVFTAPGAEQGSEIVRSEIERHVAHNTNARFIPHFGSRNYLRVLKSAKIVLGNSSSGVVEAASFMKPAVDIGNRQKNRMRARSVLNAGYDAGEIERCIRRALSPEFAEICRTVINPYDPWRDGRNSERIGYAIMNALETKGASVLLQKKFQQEVNPAEWNRLLEGFE